MSIENKIDVTKLKFSSMVFPTDADVKLWDSLNNQERKAFLHARQRASIKSGIAPNETVKERLKRLGIL